MSDKQIERLKERAKGTRVPADTPSQEDPSTK